MVLKLFCSWVCSSYYHLTLKTHDPCRVSQTACQVLSLVIYLVSIYTTI